MTARQKNRLVRRKGRGELAGQSRQTQLTALTSQNHATLHFSVILCTYNRRTLALNALASLRRQTLPFSAFEVIVVDNGSRDGTLSAAHAYANAGRYDRQKTDDIWKVYCLSEARKGLAYARNTGLLAASSEIVVFLDDDAVVDPYFLERLWQAYSETGADAIGAHVELQWEVERPYWLSDDMLDILGHFAPASERTRLSAPTSFSSSCFSVKVEALRAVGYFSPFISKRPDLPASTEVRDLCQRLYAGGYKLWYEPGALAIHRAPSARLTRPYFVGRAYWQGCSEALADYRNHGKHATPTMLRTAWRDLREFASLFFLERPLLRLAERSSSEHLQASMQQSRAWGRFQQRISLLEHAPAELDWPAVCLLTPGAQDTTARLLERALASQDIRCTATNESVPLSWLWQHRAFHGQPIGILHLYRPGNLAHSHRQQQQLWFRIWLAHRWGIRIVSTDAGGYWQSVQGIHGLRFLSQRAFERQVMQHSDAIMSFTRQPEQLYPNRRLRSRLRCLPHPGFGSVYTPAIARDEARRQLDFPPHAGFALLCLAYQHTERELLQLVEAFLRAKQEEQEQRAKKGAGRLSTQLLLVGPPCDKPVSTRILKLAARQPALHLHLSAPNEETLPLYLSAVDALVQPHFAVATAGMLETSMLALSSGLVTVVPDLPRFRGMLPPRASVYYDPASRASLAQALLEATRRDYHLSEREKEGLDAESGWAHYASRLVKVYRNLLEES